MAYYYNLNYYTGNVGNVEVGNIAVFLGKTNSPNVYEGNATLNPANANVFTTLQFVGRNYSNITVTPDGAGDNIIYGYGRAINQNLLNLLQNFANTSGNLANTTVYPNFLPGQLVYVSSNTNGKTNQAFLTTDVGNYTSAVFSEIITAGNPGTEIRNSNTTTTSRVAILNPNGPVIANINNVANVMVMSSSDVSFGTTATANMTVNGNITMSGTTIFTGESANIRFMTNSNVAFSNVITVANGISVSNITDGYVNARYFTGTLTAAANNQPNIQQIGNMTANLSIGSGNLLVYAGNIDAFAGNIVVASGANGAGYMFKGDAGGISNIPGSQIVGNLPANIQIGFANMANYAGNIIVNAQPNITSVGTLTSLNVTGLVTAGNVNGGNLVQANFLQGTLTTANQPNITTLNNITVTGNLTVQGNIIGGASSNFNAAIGNFTTRVESPLGNITTINSSNINTDDINADTGNIDTLISVDFTTANLVANIGNIATINATNINVSDSIIADGTVEANYGNFNISVNSPLGNFSNEIRATWANLTANVTTNWGNFNIGVKTTGITTGASANTGNIRGTWNLRDGSSLSAVETGSYITVADLRSSNPASSTSPGTMTGAWTVTGSLAASGNVSGGNLSTSGVVDATGNITGGNLITGGNASVTGNLSAGNISTAGVVTATGNVSGGNLTTAGVVTATGNVSGGNLITGGLINASGNITGGNIITTGTGDIGTVKTTAITTGANTTAGTITGTWTLSAGSKLNATYADLAEYYSADQKIDPATVVEFGGTQEIQICNTVMSTRVAGVISTNPAFVMNESNNSQQIMAPVALVGRVPCMVIGTCSKGDLMISAGHGYAKKADIDVVIGSVIGKSLENKDYSEMGVIEIVVGRL